MKNLIPLFILIITGFAFGQAKPTPQTTPFPKQKAEASLPQPLPIATPVPEKELTLEEIAKAEARSNKVIGDAGIAFKQGLHYLKDNRRVQAGDDFNKSVEVFLMSEINLTAKIYTKARDCYNQLIETIYRIEFPSDAQLPQIRSLSATCGWSVDNQLADDIAKLVRPSSNKPANDSSLIAAAIGRVSTSNSKQNTGFNEQKFEISPLDELSKLELTQEEYIAYKETAGNKPVQLKDGTVRPVMDYFNEHFNDPYSMRFVRWSPVTKCSISRFTPCWQVSVKFRAKNAFGAYILAEETYFIRKGKVFNTTKGFIEQEKRSMQANNTATTKPVLNSRSRITPPNNIRVVKAMAGDTVAKVAQRVGANATEVAKFNGLLPNSVLPAGREIKIPNN
jgi:LysM repeat protein